MNLMGIELLITVFAYLIYPIIYVKRNGKVAKKEGKRIAFWNSVVWALIFMFIRFLQQGAQAEVPAEAQLEVVNFGPAVLYYFIAKWILIDKNMIVVSEEEIKEFQTPLKEEEKVDNRSQVVDPMPPLIFPVSSNVKGKPTTIVENINEPLSSRCSSCGKEINEKMNFCSACGSKITDKEEHK